MSIKSSMLNSSAMLLHFIWFENNLGFALVQF